MPGHPISSSRMFRKPAPGVLRLLKGSRASHLGGHVRAPGPERCWQLDPDARRRNASGARTGFITFGDMDAFQRKGRVP